MASGRAAPDEMEMMDGVDGKSGAAARLRTTVAVVGAGLAGLSAARQLARRNVDVQVLEARDRVGGRTLTKTVAGEPVDLGAQWIGPGQHHVRALVQEFDIETFDQFTDGVAQIRAGGKRSRGAQAIRALPLTAQLNLLLAIRRIGTLSRRVPLDAPYEAPNAADWDATTVASWRDRILWSTPARETFDAVIRAVFGVEPGELSLLYFLFYVNAAGGFGRLTSVEGGAQQTRLVGGTQQLAERLAESVPIHLEAPVRKISQNDDGLVLRSPELTVTARYAVVAMPPSLAGRITYDPPLPAARDGLSQRAPTGSVIKCVAAYEEPFWRAEGLSGEVVDAQGPVGLIYDDSPADGSAGALVGFLLGDNARTWADADPADRRQAVLDRFVAYFGEAAAEPDAYTDHAWATDQYSRGCYAGNPTPGTLTSYGPAIREPVDRIHWAGTETATRWAGYMDGAISSGRRAAAEVASRLP